MIYFARCGQDGPIKIGHTIGSIAARISFLQTGCPWTIFPMGTMEGDLQVEAALLKRFSHLNVRGEWFHPTDEIVSFIQDNIVPEPQKTIPVICAASIDDEDWPLIIHQVMALNGWKQVDLAEALGLHQAMVSKWKGGKHGPSRSARILLRSMLTAAQEKQQVAA